MGEPYAVTTTWLLRHLTHTGTVDSLTGIGAVPHLLDTAGVEAASEAYHARHSATEIREAIAHHERALEHEVACLTGMLRALHAKEMRRG